MELIDLHCHIMPYVDDGASVLDEALELLQEEAEQGVHTICLTPHLREHMFETPDEKILAGYQRLQKVAADNGIPVQLFMSREYHCDDLFWSKLHRNELFPIGSRHTLLMEFSYSSDYDMLLEAAERVQKRGFVPLIAHVERYRCTQKEPEGIARLIEMGCMIQVNASSILGLEGWIPKRTAKKLLKKHYVTVVASDSHDVVHRTPNLKKCAEYLTKKFGREYAQELLYTNPLAILTENSEEQKNAEG